MTKLTPVLTSAIILIATALLLLGPAAAHPNAGPITHALMWAALLGGLIMLGAEWVRGRRAAMHGAGRKLQ